jgi:hypothetical protein
MSKATKALVLVAAVLLVATAELGSQAASAAVNGTHLTTGKIPWEVVEEAVRRPSTSSHLAKLPPTAPPWDKFPVRACATPRAVCATRTRRAISLLRNGPSSLPVTESAVRRSLQLAAFRAMSSLLSVSK